MLPCIPVARQTMHISVPQSSELYDERLYLTGILAHRGLTDGGLRQPEVAPTMRQGPVVRRRKLGAELRRQRLLAGLTSDQAARGVSWHQSKVSRIETGRSAARPADVILLLDAYGVTDPELRLLLTTLAGDEGTGKGWWLEYQDLLPRAYQDFISLETGASRARALQTSVVPGLLQTPAYARAVTRTVLPRLTSEDADALARVRLTRQSVLRQETPLELSVVLDEAVLRREIGGRRVLAEQRRHLVEMAGLPHVRLQVLPFSHGGHTGLTGPFVILSFPRIADLDVVVLDHLTNSLYLEGEEDVRTYSTAFDLLCADALGYGESLAFIAEIDRAA